ncbi:MAG: hypothetical protein J6U56_09210 [Spirochaetia bacterium]|nr:hypothetical protein [Spirochaetia bacterium]
MLKKVLFLLLLVFTLSLFISCDGGFPFISEMWEKNSHSGGGGGSHTITVKAEPAAKYYSDITPLPDPALTYTFNPDPLPSGISFTGSLRRDPGEDIGTYVIRQGTLELSGRNADKYTIKFITSVFSIIY